MVQEKNPEFQTGNLGKSSVDVPALTCEKKNFCKNYWRQFMPKVLSSSLRKLTEEFANFQKNSRSKFWNWLWRNCWNNLLWISSARTSGRINAQFSRKAIVDILGKLLKILVERFPAEFSLKIRQKNPTALHKRIAGGIVWNPRGGLGTGCIS